MAIKTTVQCVTHNMVGYSRIDANYTVNGVVYETRVAIYSAGGGTFYQYNEYNTCQFSGMVASTTYMLKSIYVHFDEVAGEYVIDGEIPNTEVEFTTHAASFYTPVATVLGDSISIAELEDGYWMPEQQGITGFGVGVKVYKERVSDENLVGDSPTTPLELSDLEPGTYVIYPYYWTGLTPQTSIMKGYIYAGTSVEVEEVVLPELDVFAFPSFNDAELHVRLQNFNSPSSMVIEMDGEQVYEKTSDIENKVYVVAVDDLDDGETYTIEVTVTDGGVDTTKSVTFTTKVKYTHQQNKQRRWKDFYIAVGQPGAYSKNMVYDEVFGMYERFGIRIKHAPYSPMAKVKNMVVQSWKDEDGDDVWLPRTHGSSVGTYLPAITHEAVDYNPVFVIYGDKDVVNSNDVIRRLLKKIEGRWLKVWDEYTQMGFEGVYLIDVDDDPKFKRRDYDYVQFTLKFKINGTNIDAPFEGI